MKIMHNFRTDKTDKSGHNITMFFGTLMFAGGLFAASSQAKIVDKSFLASQWIVSETQAAVLFLDSK